MLNPLFLFVLSLSWETHRVAYVFYVEQKHATAKRGDHIFAHLRSFVAAFRRKPLLRNPCKLPRPDFNVLEVRHPPGETRISLF
eukprot:COSAG06_NODE_1521_length_9206_cov_45.018667_5_plen_84_part_00